MVRRIISLRNTLLILVFLFLEAFIVQSAQTGSSVSPNLWNRTPKREPSVLSQGIEQRRKLLLWGKTFDQGGASAPLDEAASSLPHIAVDRYIPVDPLPAKSSDLIAVATFANYQPHLSPSKRSIYTDLQFTLDDVVMTRHSAVTDGGSIDMLLPGGSIILDSGQVRQYALNAGDEFELTEGHKYLLFCTYDPALDTYSILKHYDITTGTVVAVDPLERAHVNQNKPSYVGQPSATLINDTKEAMANSKSGQ